MHFTENFKQAYKSLSANKLRSILTMVGIIMGVFSVVAILAIGNAAKSFMQAEFNKLGANTIILQYRSSDLSESDLMTMHDQDIILEALPEVVNISAVSSRNGTIRLPEKTRSATVVGITSQYTSFQTLDVALGRFINEEDVNSNRKVVFIDDNFAKRYFGKVDVIGEELKLTNASNDIIKLTIVGVQDTGDDPFSSMMDNEQVPATIIIPLSTFQTYYNVDHVDRFDMAIKEGEQLKATGDKLIKLLEFVHQNKEKYMATSVQDIQESVGNVLGVISAILLVIAVITLVVGGIGIINILLVSVTERIREIGIRKALGARKKDIVLQFLTESIMMTGTSGLIGIMLGVICGAIISKIIKIPPVVDFKTILFTFLGSVVLGIIFGVYPAKKAADLNPIESLRYE
ncbi:MAG: macrolide export ATP-binding/permease MacB [Firmicutes bacterium HGW-Firmicutes-1]|jgi:putative ABC transport system permease protein|nr:MAG: macrolide export ATP-binding/permease MacB [Firmicutes bacterium HGW-Firmicutes-1]